MGFSFDKAPSRQGTASIKWDVKEGELPMWVADMDFAAAPPVEKAIRDRAAHPVFGYTFIPNDWYDAYIHWWKDRHATELRRDSLFFVHGIVPAIGACVRDLTAAGDGIVIQTPVYYVFALTIEANGRRVVENPLWYHNGIYSIDFEDLERKLKRPESTMMVLCNPQNPSGQTWSREELIRIAEMCRTNGVILISDEIHCDITKPGVSYTPLDSLPEECLGDTITLLSPTKAFNIAGLATAAAYVPKEHLRQKVQKAFATYGLTQANSFAVPAAVAAFRDGAAWLDAMCAYVFANKEFAEGYLARHAPLIHVVPSDCTYLMWLDVSALTRDAEVFAKELREETGLFVSAGNAFGANGSRFLRMNVACPREYVEDGLRRLEKFTSFA